MKQPSYQFAVYRKISERYHHQTHHQLELKLIGYVVAASPIGPSFNARFNDDKRGSPKYVMHYLGEFRPTNSY